METDKKTEKNKKQRRALVAGSTGLVGKLVVNELLENPNYETVNTLSRHSLNISHPKLREQIIDFHHLDEYPEAFKVDDIFCCLGTTIKDVKSKDLFSIVDQYFPKALAQESTNHAVENFNVITSVGANKNSSVFYLKVKGELEEKLEKLPLNACHIYRPSFLLGKRKKRRLKESLIYPFILLLNYLPIPQNIKPSSAQMLAKHMVENCKKNKKGIFYYHNKELKKEESL